MNAIVGIKVIVLVLGAVKQQITADVVNLEIPNLNVTELEDQTYRFTPVVVGSKVFTAASFAKVNWFVAQQYCSNRGLTLASLNSATEADLLRRHLIQRGLTPEHFWLSGTNLGDIDRWSWFSNGLPIIFASWALGQPDNNQGNERCLVSTPNGWHDYDCYTKFYFICENRCSLDDF